MNERKTESKQENNVMHNKWPFFGKYKMKKEVNEERIKKKKTIK